MSVDYWIRDGSGTKDIRQIAELSDVQAGGAGSSLANDFANLDSVTVSSNSTILPLPPGGVGYRFDNVTSANNVIGMTAAPDNTIYLFFITDTSEIDIIHNSSSAPTSQRFFCPNRQSFNLREYTAVYVRYDASLNTSGRWHLVTTLSIIDS